LSVPKKNIISIELDGGILWSILRQIILEKIKDYALSLLITAKVKRKADS
jgi:hypothetical protein